MWIRSQDRKTLVNAEKISVSKEHEVFRIYYVNYFLGEYSTEENAMKVIGMIEGAIIDNEISNHKCKIIFYMPKDDEVDV